MGLSSTIRSAVKIANGVTKDIQVTVVREPYSSESLDGDASYGTAVGIKALVTLKQKMVKAPDGRLVMSSGSVTFLQPMLLDTRDKLTLPSGKVIEILVDDESLVDPATNKGYLAQVYFA